MLIFIDVFKRDRAQDIKKNKILLVKKIRDF